ncbi:CIS tube protein [Paludibacterium paludis]|uniref:Contractile injection system tube protein N-terminal domain-containing protein n=1 Tax=Paludibacterium paludis TaxID=1225769 RepID=A0A918U9R3_9NEIS|nr:peptidoglycan-binding protein [Paludibacterium paludis]GGY13829.1 hypothetical protein GCM10011289_16480 [Paludibacterium paludis]
MLSVSAQRTPLKITACEDNNGQIRSLGRSVSLLINPAQLVHERRTCFSSAKPMGDVASGRQFSHMPPGKLSFTVVLDGTGAVPKPALSLLPDDVDGQIQALGDIIYDYKGVSHQPCIVEILWGRMLFTGRLTSFNVTYTLFKPGGAPLRATAALAFDSYTSRKKSQLKAARSSPDLSHHVEVQSGDTLPLLCERIYGDSRYYADVARFNGLRNFRELPPGTRLHFPPLE